MDNHIGAVSDTYNKCSWCDKQFQFAERVIGTVCQNCSRLLRGAGLSDEEIANPNDSDSGHIGESP